MKKPCFVIEVSIGETLLGPWFKKGTKAYIIDEKYHNDYKEGQGSSYITISPRANFKGNKRFYNKDKAIEYMGFINGKPMRAEGNNNVKYSGIKVVEI